MQRTVVQVAKMRMVDLVIGDVMNRDPQANDGWFVIEHVRRLPNGDLNFTNTETRNSVMGTDNNIVGVQVAKVVELEDATGA